MNPSEQCFDIIKEFEALELEAYLDGGGVPTIGWGHTSDWKRKVKLGDKITKEEAEDLIKTDVYEASNAINDYVEIELTQNQYDALCSFVFNIGIDAFRSSTLLRMINQERSIKDCAPQFNRWVHDNGKVVAGLVRRRKLERKLFES